MSSNAIIRGIWGNALAARRHQRPPNVYAAMLNKVLGLLQRGDHYDRFYCFGADNAAFLQYHGVDAVCLDRSAWCSPKVRPEFHHRWDGAWVHGFSHWWHKFKIIEAALREFDSVLWIDTDIQQKRPLPDDFWLELNQGPDFRASLYLQRNWTWGAGWRHARKWLNSDKYQLPKECSGREAKIVPGCGYVRFNNSETVQELLEIQNEHHFWLDHQVLAYLLDRRYGRWIGTDTYRRLGYHTQSYYYGRQLFRPEERQIIWQAGELQDPVE